MTDLLNGNLGITKQRNNLKTSNILKTILIGSTNSALNETKTIYDAHFITQTSLIAKNHLISQECHVQLKVSLLLQIYLSLLAFATLIIPLFWND